MRKTLTILTALALSAGGIMLGEAAQPARYAYDASNTPGWSLMTAAERTEHQNKMLAVKTYDECKAVQDEQRKFLEARAKEKGVTLAAAKVNACDRMKAKGIIK